jgi:signal transduction histidine kinase
MATSDPIQACTLFGAEIRHARSEVLIALEVIQDLEYLGEIGIVDSLKQAQRNGVNVMILYSMVGKNEAPLSEIISTTKDYAQIKSVSGIHGKIFLIDNSKVLTIDQDYNGIHLFRVYSDKSIVKNIGSLLDSLWNEKEILDSIIALKNNLVNSNRIQEEFIAIAAHELRTPLTPLLAYAEMLEIEENQERDEQERIPASQKNGDKSRMDYIDVIIRSAKRLEQTSELILDLAMIETKKLKLDKEQLNLSSVISDVVDDQTITIAGDVEKRKNIKLRYESGQDNIPVLADKMRLRRVISNLLSNAVKFTNGGVISIKIKKEYELAIVAIEDNGSGIDQEIMPRLFSKFATKSNKGSTGLELFICKSVIEAHGGTISAYNNKDGKRGATFTFTLPLITSGQMNS